MRAEIFGVSVEGFTMEEAVSRALDIMKEKRGAYVCTPNPEMLWRCRKDRALKEAVTGADMLPADGVGVLWAAEKLGTPLPERVAGIDFFLTLLSRMEGTVFLLGGEPGVAEEAAAVIREKYPAVTVVGCCHGYFEDESVIAEMITRAAPDLLAVCLGSPKQELLMSRFAAEKLPVGLMAGLGGSLDVLSGRVKRAPEKWIQWRMEWLYRLLQRPSRIKRLLCLPGFVLAVMAQRKKL